MSVELARIVYWCLALVPVGGAVVSAWVGVRAVRDGRVDDHRRWMNRASLWVIAFLVSYLLKLALLGREPLATWSAGRIVVLNVHRALVESMLVLGVVNRILGRVVLGAATLGFGTALVVLVQMILASGP